VQHGSLLGRRCAPEAAGHRPYHLFYRLKQRPRHSKPEFEWDRAHKTYLWLPLAAHTLYKPKASCLY